MRVDQPANPPGSRTLTSRIAFFAEQEGQREHVGQVEHRKVEKVFDGLETWQIEPERLTPVGDHVAVVIRYRARVHGSRADVEARESALWTLRDGKVVRYAWFHEPADALEAAELSE